MKILIATGLYPPESGGPATHTKLLEERLPAYGFSVSVLPFSTVRHLPKVVRHVVYGWRCFAAREVSLVLAQDTVSVGFPAAIGALLSGKKFVVRVTGDYAWEQARQRFGVLDDMDTFQTKRYGLRTEALRALQRFVVRRAHTVIVPSDYMKKIVSAWGVRPVRVYNGIKLPLAPELPQECPPGFLVVSAGRRVPWKGFEALERVVGREQGWALFIAEGLPRAQALGWVKSADVFVLNSQYEGLSHQLLEAMALGVPIVATAVGGNPELITDGKEGLLVAPGDDAALYRALKNIEQDRAGAQTRAEAAARKAQEFSVDHTLPILAALLKT